MNYLEQLKAFDLFCEINRLSANAQIIWYKLMSINNKCMWKEWFQVDNKRLMYLTDISDTKTLIRNREKLINNGLIGYKKGKKGQPSTYLFFFFYPENATKNATKNATENATKNATKNATENATENATHNKHKTKTKTKTKEKNILKKENFAEFVTLTAEEHQKLIDEYGESAVKCMIDILDNYKGQSGRTYKSDYRAILNWVVKRAKEDYPREFRRKSDDDDLPFGEVDKAKYKDLPI